MFDRKPNNNTQVGVHKAADLPVINPDDLAVEFKVKVLAKDNAGKNLPSLTASSPDSNEQKFRIHLTNRAMQATNEADVYIKGLQDQHAAIMISKENTDIEKMPNEFKTKTNTELKPILDEIKEEVRQCRLTDDELIKFKKDNHLDREAVYPSDQLVIIVIVGGILLGESMLNAFFFATGLDGGIFAGFAMAVAFSIINLSIGFFSGKFVLPNTNHISQTKKRVYWACTVVITLILLPVVNLFIAHYREALNLNPDNATNILAWDSLTNGLFSLTDANSWLLAVLGLLFAMVAMYEGYSSDDKYPGYGKLTKKKYEKIGGLDTYKESARQKLIDIHEEFKSELEDNEEVMNESYKRSNKMISGVEYYLNILEEYIKSCETGYKQIVTLYREENTSARQDGVPEYFSQPIDSSLKVKSIKKKYNDNRKEMKETIENLNVSMIGIRNEMQEIKKDFITKINDASLL